MLLLHPHLALCCCQPLCCLLLHLLQLCLADLGCTQGQVLVGLGQLRHNSLKLCVPQAVQGGVRRAGQGSEWIC